MRIIEIGKEIIMPFYDYFDYIKEGKSEAWLIMENKLNDADWQKYTEHFRKHWEKETTKSAYINPYDSSSPWHWEEMFEAFGLIDE